MINRTLVRTKVLQNLYAFYSETNKTIITAEKELLSSFSDTYSLYIMLFELMNKLVRLEEERIASEEEKAKIMHIEYIPQRRFVENRLASQVYQNLNIRHYVEENQLSWDGAEDSITKIYQQIISSTIYEQYMQKKEVGYEDDKHIWRKIFSDILVDNAELEIALDELEVNGTHQGWIVDYNVVLSYAIKTIKHFEEVNGDSQEILAMFDTEEELEFGQKLLEAAIIHAEEYKELISERLQNWTTERIAYMDLLIMQIALAEIFTFPNIAIQVSMNEYLELAKEYSTEKSASFINGILDDIVRKKRRDGELMKDIIE